MNSKNRKYMSLKSIGVITLLLFILCPSINAQRNPKQVIKIAESAVRQTKARNPTKVTSASANQRLSATITHNQNLNKRKPVTGNRYHPQHNATRKVSSSLNAQKPNKASLADNANVKKRIEYKPLTAEWDKEWINRIEVEINRVLWLNSVDVEMDSEDYSPPVRINYQIEHNKHTSLIIYINYEYKLYAA